MNKQIDVILGDIENKIHTEQMLMILNSYMLDSMGIGQPLSQDLKENILHGLKDHPGYLFFLAYSGRNCVGMANCFIGFSTFQGRNLLNIHDIAIDPMYRGKGVGDALLGWIIEYAKRRSFCRINLEVRTDNIVALSLYLKHGFDNCTPPMIFLERLL